MYTHCVRNANLLAGQTSFAGSRSVMPAEAGIQEFQAKYSAYSPWIPAFAGMTNLRSLLQVHAHSRRVSPLTTVLALFIFILLSPYTHAFAQDKELIAAGKREFRHSCVLCHGLTGRGESVMTTFNLLAIKPPDLRQLRKRNNGTFPFWQMYRVIDGRQEIMAHGSRDMPIWGDVFIRQEDGTIADDARAIGRILQLLYYLESIQQH